MGLVFEDFGAGTAIGEDDSGFPDEGCIGRGDVFDLAVHFDDEAGEDAFGHEAFVAMAEGEVVGAVPGVVGRGGAEQVRGDVVTGAVGNFVADFELFHQLQQFVVQVGVFGAAPDVGKVGVGELSEVLFDTIAI